MTLSLGWDVARIWSTSLGFLELVASRKVRQKARESGASYTLPLTDDQREQKQRAVEFARTLAKGA